MKKVTITLKQGDLNQARDFAGARRDQTETINKLKERNQGDPDKFERDCYMGALGEIAAYRLLKQLGIKVSPPDFSIHEVKNKSYDADLTDKEGYRYHIKSQERSKEREYGGSWLFQYGGEGTGNTDTLFNKRTNKDLFIPCIIDEYNKEVNIYGCYQIDTLFKKDMVKLPAHKSFHAFKRAINLEDILTLAWYERWGRLKKGIMV